METFKPIIQYRNYCSRSKSHHFTLEGVTFYTINEVAQLLGISRASVHNYMQSGKLPTQQFGRSYFISHKDLEKFIKDFTGRDVDCSIEAVTMAQANSKKK